MTTYYDELERRFKILGADFRAISSTRLKELKPQIDEQYQSGRIHPGTYEEDVKKFTFEAPEGFGKESSILVVAIPKNIAVVTFQLAHRKIKAVIPPIYIFRKTRSQCLELLMEVLGDGRKIERARVPLKLLAARSGLGRYGKNSLCYTGGSGSFTRVAAFFVDHPFDRDGWGNAESLEQCGSCSRCIDNCPTRSIDRKGFFIDAGRCLTYFNESERAFPDFIDHRAHNSLVGCVRCQVVCPANSARLKDKTVVASFDEEETLLILNNRVGASSELTEKLTQLDMDEYQNTLSRNLKALMRR